MYAPAPRDPRQFGELGFRIKLPKFIRKMKPLRVLGKAAKFAAPFIPGAGVLTSAAIAAGGEVLNKGKRAKLLNVAKAGVIGGAGRFAVKKIVPKAFRFAKKEAGALSRLLHPKAKIPGAPNVTPPTAEQIADATAASQEQISPVTTAIETAAGLLRPSLPSLPGATPEVTATDTATASTPDEEGNTPAPTEAGMSPGLKTALIGGTLLVGMVAMSKGRRR